MVHGSEQRGTLSIAVEADSAQKIWAMEAYLELKRENLRNRCKLVRLQNSLHDLGNTILHRKKGLEENFVEAIRQVAGETNERQMAMYHQQAKRILRTQKKFKRQLQAIEEIKPDAADMVKDSPPETSPTNQKSQQEIYPSLEVYSPVSAPERNVVPVDGETTDVPVVTSQDYHPPTDSMIRDIKVSTSNVDFPIENENSVELAPVDVEPTENIEVENVEVNNRSPKTLAATTNRPIETEDAKCNTSDVDNNICAVLSNKNLNSPRGIVGASPPKPRKIGPRSRKLFSESTISKTALSSGMKSQFSCFVNHKKFTIPKLKKLKK